MKNDFYYLFDNIQKYTNKDFENFYYKIRKNKQKRIKQIAQAEDKKRSILGEILLINGLKLFFNIDYNSIEILETNSGKPIILNKKIYFNISHSYDYCVCVFANTPIGVDIEKNRIVHERTIKYLLNKTEQETLRLKKCNFFFWFTLKEAFIKMNGFELKNIIDYDFKYDLNAEYMIKTNKNFSFFKIHVADNYICFICKKNTIN